MKIYVTKYALTKGILEGRGYSVGKLAIVTFENEMGRFTRTFSELDWWVTKEKAIARAEEMRNRAREDMDSSLDKQREKLSALVFD